MQHIVNSPGSSLTNFPSSLNNNDELIFNNTSIGRSGTIINWTVPHDGIYRIETWGAEGGASTDMGAGGRGARMRGDFLLHAGRDLRILVGQQGGTDRAGGGGGGTFVVLPDNTPLVVAGGGGGRSIYSSSTTNLPGVASTSGRNSTSNTAAGGTSGGGGASHSQHSGGGGGGLIGNGESFSPLNTYWAEGGRSFVNGGLGGGAYYVYANGQGGFGGGGMSGHNGGGGGGYSGGAGGVHSNQGAGGGGSFNSGENQSNSTGVRTGHGRIRIIMISRHDDGINAENLSISQSFIPSEKIGISELSFALTLAKRPKEVININYSIKLNGDPIEERSTVTPAFVSKEIPWSSFSDGENHIEIYAQDLSGEYRLRKEFVATKEDRDTFQIRRGLQLDRFHVERATGKVNLISQRGYGPIEEGSGSFYLEIPSDGKSTIEGIRTSQFGDGNRVGRYSLKKTRQETRADGYYYEFEPLANNEEVLRDITGYTVELPDD